MKLIFLGAPGAGKGTQSEFISKHLNIPVIATGAILREAMKAGTPVGKKAKEYVESGKLVPDDVIIDIVRERLAGPDCKDGFVLDGVPRTIPQAEALERSGIIFDAALSIEIADEAIIKRMSGRRICSKCEAVYNVDTNPPKREGVCDACEGELITRGDDAPELVKSRLEIFHKQTAPLLDFYNERGILRPVENQPTIEATTAIVFSVLGI